METSITQNVNIANVLKNYGKMEVKLHTCIKGKLQLAIRFWIGTHLLKLANWVMSNFAEIEIIKTKD